MNFITSSGNSVTAEKNNKGQILITVSGKSFTGGLVQNGETIIAFDCDSNKVQFRVSPEIMQEYKNMASEVVADNKKINNSVMSVLQGDHNDLVHGKNQW